MQPFPFQQLPFDLRNLIAQQPGVFSRLAPLSRQTQRSLYALPSLKLKCDLPIDNNEILAVAPLYFKKYIFLRTLSIPSGTLIEFLSNPVVLEGTLQKIQEKHFEERIAALALNLDRDKFFESTEPSLYQPNLKEAIEHLLMYGLKQLPARYLYLIYQRRQSCLNLDRNYAINKVVEELDRNVDLWLGYILKDKRLTPFLKTYLEMFAQDLTSVNIDNLDDTVTIEQTFEQAIREYRRIKQELPTLLLR